MSARTVGERITLRIEKPVAGGRMLARDDGGIVLVSGALPGESVEARVERTQRGTVWAQTEQVLEASPHRTGVFNPCGGSVLAHAHYEHQLELKQQIIQDAFARLARLPIAPPAIVPSRPDGYRMRARLHVQSGRIGFYLEATHTLCPARQTRQLLPQTLEVLDGVGERLQTMPTAVGAIDVSENRDASERAVHLELAPDADPSRLGGLATVPGITALSWSHARSPRVRVVSGNGRVTDRFTSGEREWTISRSAQAFFQGNRYLLEALVDHVRTRLCQGPVTDLYAGAGLFAIAAAAAGHAPVIAVEGDTVSAADLKRNTLEWRGLVQARHESVEVHVHDRRTIRPQTLIVDPPRTGLSPRALAGIIALRAPRVVYVSCDVATLARDVRGLLAAGYAIGQVTAFDLFPDTAHVETVAVLDLA